MTTTMMTPCFDTRFGTRFGTRFDTLADCAIFLRELVLADVGQCLEGGDEAKSILLRLTRRCAAALDDPQPWAHFCYDESIDDAPRAPTFLERSTTRERKIVASAEEMAAAWACFFYLHSASMHAHAFQLASLHMSLHMFERVGVAVTKPKEMSAIAIAYIILGHEDAIAPWFRDTHCVRGTNLPSGTCTFDPVALAGGHGAPVDPKTYGSATTAIAWLT